MDVAIVNVIELSPPTCGRNGGKIFQPNFSLDDYARNGCVIIECPARVGSMIYTGMADNEPVDIHDCRHCRTVEFL